MDSLFELKNEIIPLFFNRLTKSFLKQYNDVMRSYGLSKLHTLYLLCFIKNPNGLRLNDFNSEIGCDKANTSRAIADLEEKNIVYRDISIEGEKKFLIKLTNNGERIAKDLCLSAKKQIDRSFSCLTNDEQKSFVGIMKKLISMECEYDTD